MDLPHFDTDGLRNALHDAKRIVITTHRKPDGDAIGSALAMYHLLKNEIPARIDVIAPTPYAEFLHFLPGDDLVLDYENHREEADSLIEEAEIVCCLDFNRLSRLEDMEEAVSKGQKSYLLIDHHPNPDDFYNWAFLDEKAGSTAELIYRFMDHMGWTNHLNRKIAECLYLGVMTDTGSFRFSSVTAQTHRIIAELLDTGLDHAAVHSRVFDTARLEKIKFTGYALYEKLTCRDGEGYSFMALSKEELDRFNYTSGDSEGLVNYGLSIEGVKATALFLETEEYIKISFRSVGDVAVNEMAGKHFQGGGHRNAAGGKFDGPLDEAVSLFEKSIKEIL